MVSDTLPATVPSRSHSLRDPAFQAFVLLRTAFTVAPIVFGVDKFFSLLIDWQRYLSPTVDHLVPGTGHQLMLRDFGLLLAALALVRLAPAFRRSTLGASKGSAS